MVRVIRGFIIPYPRYDPNTNTYVDVLDVTDELKKTWPRLLEYLSVALKHLNTYYEGLLELLKQTENSPEKARERLQVLLGDKHLLISDVIVWLLRAPLYQDPVENVIVSPYKLYIILRLLPPEILKILFEEIGILDISKPLETLRNILEIAHKFSEWVCREELDVNVAASDRVLNSVVCLLKLVDEEEFRQVVEKALLLTPADTRPGFNTVNLITHLILTSAITWALGGSGKEVLAALLHDIGKPLDPENHVKKSVDEARRLLSNVYKILTRDEIDETILLIEKHHERGIIERADKIAAGERNLQLVKKILVKDLREKIRKLVEEKKLKKYRGYLEDPTKVYELKGKEGWEFWNSLDANDIIELTSKYVREVKKQVYVSELGISGKLAHEVKVALIDFRGIQSAIRRTDNLRILIATSYAIDYMVITYTPLLFSVKLGMPLSAIVYNAGGTLLVLLPDKLSSSFNIVVGELNRMLQSFLDMSLAYTIEVFSSDYADLSRRLGVKIAYEKISNIESNKPTIQLLGFEKPCKLCGLRPATERIDIPGEEEALACTICYDLHTIGELLHFNIKLGLKERHRGVIVDIDGRKYTFQELYRNLDVGELSKRISQKLIEYHSGWDPDRGLERQLNYSIISIDGNLMGMFMQGAVSFSDAVERSVRIDLALKKALKDTLNLIAIAIKNVCNDVLKESSGDLCYELAAREKIRIYSGVLYMGGDDGRFIAPSWASIPLALGLATYFYHYMGGYATLSIGLASAPPKHSVWGLLETSSRLEGKAKSNGRILSLNKWLLGKDQGIGSISFILTESTSMLTPSKIEFLLDEVGVDKLGISAQPYIISLDEGKELTLLLSKLANVIELLKETSTSKSSLHEVPSNLKTVLDLALAITGIGFLSVHYVKTNAQTDKQYIKRYVEALNKAKRVINELIETYSKEYNKLLNPLAAKAITIVYAKRQANRRRDSVEKSLYESIIEIANSIRREKKNREQGKEVKIVPLHDLYLLIKIIGGGAI